MPAMSPTGHSTAHCNAASSPTGCTALRKTDIVPARKSRRRETAPPKRMMLPGQMNLRGAGASKPERAEPGVYSFRDGSPPRLQHHVVPHVGKELCFGAIRVRRRENFFSGVGSILVGT